MKLNKNHIKHKLLLSFSTQLHLNNWILNTVYLWMGNKSHAQNQKWAEPDLGIDIQESVSSEVLCTSV